MASLATDVNRLFVDVDSLLDLINDAKSLELKYQKLVAETAMLRLFYHLESAIEAIAFKLARNIPFGDASRPRLLLPPFSSIGAVESHILGGSARRRRSTYLKWTTLSDVQNNLRGIFDSSDHFLTHRSAHDAVYEAMRHVRNHIAHGSKSTKRKFTPVVMSIFTGSSRGVSAGKLLLSCRPAFVGAPLSGSKSIIEQYLVWSKTFVKSLAKL